MISAERRIGINVRIMSPTTEIQESLVQDIKHDLVALINHYANETEEDVIVSIIPEATCGNCGKLIPHCTCGKPSPRPAV